jgi:hypothetical protein
VTASAPDAIPARGLGGAGTAAAFLGFGFGAGCVSGSAVAGSLAAGAEDVAAESGAGLDELLEAAESAASGIGLGGAVAFPASGVIAGLPVGALAAEGGFSAGFAASGAGCAATGAGGVLTVGEGEVVVAVAVEVVSGESEF